MLGHGLPLLAGESTMALRIRVMAVIAPASVAAERARAQRFPQQAEPVLRDTSPATASGEGLAYLASLFGRRAARSRRGAAHARGPTHALPPQPPGPVRCRCDPRGSRS